MNPHLSDDELLDRVYGLGESCVPHLRQCEECSARLEAFLRRRTDIVAGAALEPLGANNFVPSNEFLMAQRRAVYARLDKAPAARMHWAPAALAVAFLLVMGVFLVHPLAPYRPAGPPAPASAGVELNEEQLFSDLYSMEQSVEPRAAAPIHALFEGPEAEEQ
jgi:hypothetical protein